MRAAPLELIELAQITFLRAKIHLRDVELRLQTLTAPSIFGPYTRRDSRHQA